MLLRTFAHGEWSGGQLPKGSEKNLFRRQRSPKELENRPTIEVAVHSHGNAPYLPPMKVSFFK